MVAVKHKVLVSWIGASDLKAVIGGEVGPVRSALAAVDFDGVELLCAYPAEQVERYLGWLREQVDISVTAHAESLSSPVHFGEIYHEIGRASGRERVL